MNRLDKFKERVRGSGSRFTDFLPIITPSADMKRITNLDVIMNFSSKKCGTIAKN